jgi:hypothetical protein
MGNGPLDLAFTISADPTQAQAALAGLQAFVPAWESQIQKANTALGASATGVGEQFDKALLNSRQSVSLLASEFGLHLPRVVTNAIAEILPNIASLGTALLAVFAVKEVIAFAGFVRKCADEFNGVTEAARQLKEIGKENLSNMEAMAKANLEYARTQATLLIMQTEGARARVLWLRDEEAGLHALNPILTQTIQAYTYWTGKSKELKEAEENLASMEGMRGAIVKILGEDETKAHKEAAEEAKKHATELERLAAKAQAAWETQTHATYEAWEKHREEQAREVKEYEAGQEKYAKFQAEEALWRIQAIGEMHLEARARAEITEACRRAELQIRQLKERSRELREEWILERTQLRMLSDDSYNLFVPAFQAAGATMENFRSLGMNALNEFENAMGSSIAQAIVYEKSIGAAMASALKATLASLSAEALVQAIKATALGFLRLAEHDYAAASQAFTSAGIWATVGGVAAIAGRALPSTGAERGATPGFGGLVVGAPGGVGAVVRAGGPSPLAAGAGRPPQGVTVIFQGPIYGGKAGLDELIGHISDAVDRRDVRLSATTIKDATLTRDSFNG